MIYLLEVAGACVGIALLSYGAVCAVFAFGMWLQR